MLFKKQHINIVTAVAAFLLLVSFAVRQPVSYAWLATSLRSSTFSVKSSSVFGVGAELWVYDDGSGNDRSPAWYLETVDKSKETVTAKVFPTVGLTSVSNVSTLIPASLYFGTINNLVQEQENQPIYLKFSIDVKANTKNAVILSYKNDSTSVGGNYLGVYKMDLTQKDSKTGKYYGYSIDEVAQTDADRQAAASVLALLNDREKYPFLRFYYFVTTDNYSLNSGAYSDLSNFMITEEQSFSSLFNLDGIVTDVESPVEYTIGTSDRSDVVEYTSDNEASQKVVVHNSGTGSKIYIYVKINVRSDTLSEALTYSGLRNYIPAYLLFSVLLGVEIQTSAYTNPSES